MDIAIKGVQINRINPIIIWALQLQIIIVDCDIWNRVDENFRLMQDNDVILFVLHSKVELARWERRTDCIIPIIEEFGIRPSLSVN